MAEREESINESSRGAIPLKLLKTCMLDYLGVANDPY